MGEISPNFEDEFINIFDIYLLMKLNSALAKSTLI